MLTAVLVSLSLLFQDVLALRPVKRASDVGTQTLQTLVQQQATALQTLQAKVEALETRETQANIKIAALENQVSLLQSHASKQGTDV